MPENERAVPDDAGGDIPDIGTTTPGSPLGATMLGGSVQMVTMLPPYLVGALAVQITAELRFGSRGLGIATGVFFAVSAASSLHLGRLTDRLGAILTLRLGGLVALISFVGIATTARNWVSLVFWLAFAGIGLSLAQPGSNRLLSHRIPAAHLGLVLGIKQSAAPLASMLAGLSVPLIGLTVGWRWAFVVGGIMALGAIVGARSRPRNDRRKGAPRGRPPALRNRRTVMVIAAGFGLGVASNASLLTFFVASAVAGGIQPPTAGTLFAAGSIAAIGMRLLGGFICDRTRIEPLRLAAALLVLGACGMVLLSTGRPGPMAVGVFVAMIGAWGYPGVLWLSLIRAYPDAPGRVTGALAPGSLGGMVGPIVFGGLVNAAGFRLAWLTTSVIAASAAGTMAYAARRLSRAEPGPREDGDESRATTIQ
jgi:MFS family permease